MARKERERARLDRALQRSWERRTRLLVGDDARGPLRQLDVGRPGQVGAGTAQRELRERHVLQAAQAVEIEPEVSAGALESEALLADGVVGVCCLPRHDGAWGGRLGF